MNINIKIKLLRDNASIPAYATAGSAAADLKACIDKPVTIKCGEIVSLPTGIAISGERSDVVALVYGRSGMGTKYGVTLANAVGVIDSDYRGEICVSLINRGNEPYTVNPGDRVAQLMFAPVYTAEFIAAENLDETERGTGGFGSTGTN
ncbi:MAG: dUTP diphosphatase [Eubacteriales bacterium]